MARYIITVAATTLGMMVAPALTHARGPDFDRDGFEDLAIGAPGEKVGTIVNAGAVNVLYGSASGLDDPTDRITTFYQDVTDVADASEADDRFGSALAWGDFNGDCFDDLAVGVPGQSGSSGAVHVFYGSIWGLTADFDAVITRASAGVPGSVHANDVFGKTLAAGDFNGDGSDDLAVGTTNFQSGTNGTDGVIILYGGGTGLNGTNGPGAHAFSVPDHTFTHEGDQMATGDFNCDSREDIAIGAHIKNGPGGLTNAGSVTVIYGSATGLSLSAGPGSVEFVGSAGDAFGAALTAANFNADSEGGRSCIDLAIGAPQFFGSAVGYVKVLFGSAANGLDSMTAQVIDQDWSTIQGEGAADTDLYQHFGLALTSGRIDSDQYPDLLVGVPSENSKTGVVHAIRGHSSGLTAVGNQMWSQDSDYVPGNAEEGDQFGQLLTCGKYSDDGPDAFAVWTPFEFGTTPNKHGGVQVLYTANVAPPVVVAGEQWVQGYIDTQLDEPEDLFGKAMTPSRPIRVKPATECTM